MAVLLKFNDNLSYTLQELTDSLEFKNDLLHTVLQTMLKVDLITLTGTKTLDANTPMTTEVNLNPNFFRYVCFIIIIFENLLTKFFYFLVKN